MNSRTRFVTFAVLVVAFVQAANADFYYSPVDARVYNEWLLKKSCIRPSIMTLRQACEQVAPIGSGSSSGPSGSSQVQFCRDSVATTPSGTATFTSDASLSTSNACLLTISVPGKTVNFVCDTISAGFASVVRIASLDVVGSNGFQPVVAGAPESIPSSVTFYLIYGANAQVECSWTSTA